MNEEFENEYIDEDFFEEESKYTCWSELEGGCYFIHPFLFEASTCDVVGKAQILEVEENDIYKYWSIYSSMEDVLLVAENETSSFEISDEEIHYLVELEIL